MRGKKYDICRLFKVNKIIGVYVASYAGGVERYSTWHD